MTTTTTTKTARAKAQVAPEVCPKCGQEIRPLRYQVGAGYDQEPMLWCADHGYILQSEAK